MSGAAIQLQGNIRNANFTPRRNVQTFFQNTWMEHTNFAKVPYSQDLDPARNFGTSINATVEVNADLLHSVFLQITLPELQFNGDESERHHARAAWVDYIGLAMIENISAKIGNMQFKQSSGDFEQLKKQLTLEEGRRKGFLEMIGHIPALTELDDSCCGNILKPSHIITVPLEFFFTKHIGNSIPLWEGDIVFNIRTRNIEQLVNRTAAVKLGNPTFTAKLITTQITLTDEEIASKKNCPQVFLTDQVQMTGNLEINKANSYELPFSLNVKSLFWTVRNPNYLGGMFMGIGHDWEKVRDQVAKSLILAQYDLDEFGYLNEVPTDNEDMSYMGPNGASYVGINPLSSDEEQNYIFTDSNALAAFDEQNALVGILADSEPLLSIPLPNGRAMSTDYDLRYKVAGVVRITLDPKSRRNLMLEVDKVLINELTMEDLSIPTNAFGIDYRNKYSKNLDVIVWQHHNTGMYLDGKINPVLDASISIASNSLVETLPGEWFNKTEPYIHYSNTPADGVNVYSFAIDPEAYQRSGAINMSAIPKIKLNLSLRQSEIISNNKPLILNVFAENENRLMLHKNMSKMEHNG